MTDLRAAAQQALEAMRCAVPTGKITLYEWDKAASDLNAALAEHDKKIVWVEERKAHWAEQLQLARETQERERQQREEAALAERVQEPVAFIEAAVDNDCAYAYADGWNNCVRAHKGIATPQRKPLSEEEIYSLFRTVASPVMFARAVERAHGIT